MGQTHSAPAQDALRFRRMVAAAYYNDLDALRQCFDASLNILQISRATYLDIIMQEQVEIDTTIDTLEREKQQNALMDEKMEFFAAVERGRLVLGDTLLHIAVRLGHEPIVDFLLLTDHAHSGPAAAAAAPLQTATSSRSRLPATTTGTAMNTTETPNFKGELPRDVVGRNRFLQLLLENVADVHNVFGLAYRDEPRVHRLVGVLRRVWPLWMFDGQHEVAGLVRVLYSARSSDPAFGNLVKVATATAERFRRTLTADGVQLALQLVRKHNGDIQAARQALATTWTSDDKRRVLFATLFRRWFRDWHARRHDERDKAYADFFDTAMDAWLTVVQDLHLQHRTTAVSADGRSEDDDNNSIGMDCDDSSSASSSQRSSSSAAAGVVAVDAAVLQRYELQIWKRRVRPPTAIADDLCTHISALESYLELSNLQV